MKELKLTEEQKEKLLKVLKPLLDKVEEQEEQEETKSRKPKHNPVKALYENCNKDLGEVATSFVVMLPESEWFDKFDPRESGFQENLKKLAKSCTSKQRQKLDDTLDIEGKALLMLADSDISKRILLDLVRSLQFTNSQALLDIITLNAYRVSFTYYVDRAMKITNLPFEEIGPIIAGKFIGIINEINASWYYVPKDSEISFHEVSKE
nr:MAG TPA: LTXXQ motif family protein [Caudoviricetes sp.]